MSEGALTRDRRSLAVVICAYTDERLGDLVEAIESLLAQTQRPDEIVVVIDHNPALQKVITALYPEPAVMIIENRHKQGLSGARNSGVETSTAEIVAFLDDDAAAAPDWAERILVAYDDPAVLGVGGHVCADWQVKRPQWFPREFEWVVGCSYIGMPTTVAEVRNAIGANMSFRRSVFDRVGGFSTTVGRVGKKPVGCEETELSIRVRNSEPDGKIIYDPSAEVSHKVPAERATFAYFRLRCYMEGISKAQVVKLAGSELGLASERSYSTKVLPLGVLRGISDLFRGRVSGSQRAAAIVVGLLVTTAGFLRGRVAPLAIPSTDEQLSAVDDKNAVAS